MGPNEASYEVKVDKNRRVLLTRMSGLFDEAAMSGWCEEYRRKTNGFLGKKHMVIADMRGMRTLKPNLATMMGQAIVYARARGVVLCAHLSDETVQRFQVARIARYNSTHDDVTVDVGSLKEAYDVCSEGLKRIDDGTPLASIRLAI
jgi:hypothetical protein